MLPSGVISSIKNSMGTLLSIGSICEMIGSDKGVNFAEEVNGNEAVEVVVSGSGVPIFSEGVSGKVLSVARLGTGESDLFTSSVDGRGFFQENIGSGRWSRTLFIFSFDRGIGLLRD